MNGRPSACLARSVAAGRAPPFRSAIDKPVGSPLFVRYRRFHQQQATSPQRRLRIMQAMSPLAKSMHCYQRNREKEVHGTMVRVLEMFTKRLIWFPRLALLVWCATVLAQTPAPDPEPAAILELGGAGSWNVKDGSGSAGADVAAEVTPIEQWLELEGGVTPLWTRRSTEWDTDLLFKKPWELSRKVEFMCGIGPEWIHARESGVTTNSFALEAVLDFMFWPSASRRFGWFIEPGYEYGFGRGRERSVGISFGLLIGLHRHSPAQDATPYQR
jgi:hypothetical protein